MDTRKYDVFISYRRDIGKGEIGAQMASLIRECLQNAGMKVFMDTMDLTGGEFPKQLDEAIENSSAMVLILSPHALDNCAKEGDWVRHELEKALECKLTLVTVHHNEYRNPDDLPDSIREVPLHNSVRWDHEYEDAARRKLLRFLGITPTVVPTPKEIDADEAERLYREGMKFEEGVECHCDLDKALGYYKTAAEMGHPEAQYQMGTAYEEGWGGTIPEIDYAIEWWTKAADGGSPDAMYRLADLHKYGDGVEKDAAKAEKLYRQAFPLFRKRAEDNDAHAQWRLAQCYDFGKGTKINIQRAIAWYIKAAERNCILAIDYLATGDVNDITDEEHERWLQKDREELLKRAENGNPWRQFDLALLYSENMTKFGVSDEEVANWYKRAADLGHREAMGFYGIALLQGKGVDLNYGEAYEYLRKSVALGSKACLFEFGLCQILGLNGKSGNITSAIDTWLNGDEDYEEEDDGDSSSSPMYAQLCHDIWTRRLDISNRSGEKAADWLIKADCWKRLHDWHVGTCHDNEAIRDISNQLSIFYTISKDFSDVLSDTDENDVVKSLIYDADFSRTHKQYQTTATCLSIADAIFKSRDDDFAKLLLSVVRLEHAKLEADNHRVEQAIKDCNAALDMLKLMERETGAESKSESRTETTNSDKGVARIKSEIYHYLGKLHLDKADDLNEAHKALDAAMRIIEDIDTDGKDGHTQYQKKTAIISCDLASCYSAMGNRPMAYQQATIARRKIMNFIMSMDKELMEAFSCCKEILKKSRPFNEADVTGLAEQIKSGERGFGLDAYVGYFTEKYACDLVVFDSELTIPVFVFPSEKDYLPKFKNDNMEKKASTLEDCISGEVVFLEPLISLIEECSKFANPWRTEKGYETKCLIVCGADTITKIIDFVRDSLKASDEATLSAAGSFTESFVKCGCEFCSRQEVFGELAKFFNVVCEETVRKDEKYCVWLESLFVGTMMEKALKIGSAIREGVGRWRALRFTTTLGSKLDIDKESHTQGVLCENISKKEAGIIRKELVLQGALASARPMGFFLNEDEHGKYDIAAWTKPKGLAIDELSKRVPSDVDAIAFKYVELKGSIIDFVVSSDDVAVVFAVYPENYDYEAVVRCKDGENTTLENGMLSATRLDMLVKQRKSLLKLESDAQIILAIIANPKTLESMRSAWKDELEAKEIELVEYTDFENYLRKYLPLKTEAVE